MTVEWLTVGLYNLVPKEVEKDYYFDRDVRWQVTRELGDLIGTVLSKRPWPRTYLKGKKRVEFYEQYFQRNPNQFPYSSVIGFGCKLKRPFDLNVFFVPTQMDSIIASVAKKKPPDSAAGLTCNTPEGVISEVYVELNGPARKWAKIAFHELMHNKCDVGWGQSEENLHNFGGGGLAQRSGISDGTPLTEANCRYFNLHMHRGNPQYSPPPAKDPKGAPKKG
jgi:hypothetical protein